MKLRNVWLFMIVPVIVAVIVSISQVNSTKDRPPSEIESTYTLERDPMVWTGFVCAAIGVTLVFFFLRWMLGMGAATRRHRELMDKLEQMQKQDDESEG